MANRPPARAALALFAAGLLALFAAACGSGETAAVPTTMKFKLTDAGCEPHNAEVAAGPIDFEVENAGAGNAVTELEVLDERTLLGEKEGLTEGLSGGFSLTLEEGEYTLQCNGGSAEDGTLTVTGGAVAKADPQAEAAVARYRRYLVKNTDELVAKTTPFVAAVLAGDVAKAKALYPPARSPYERIEPVAETFGDLDPRIDARENDVPKSEFGGFHRIEKALWEEKTAKGMAPVAKQLQADVEELAEKVQHVDLQAVQIANGANELLNEVSSSKITGEEERYSHIDLLDFLANVEGSQAAFTAVKPLVKKKNPKLARELEADFAAVYKSLEPYERPGVVGFVRYTALTKADTRELAQVIDILADKLSKVPAEIVG